jgi:membrane protein required for colicin V production
MNWIDITILLIISLSIFWGVKKGFFSTFFSFLYIIVSFYLAGYVCHLAVATIGNNNIIQWAVFTFLFIIFFIIFSLVGRFLRFIGNIVISGVADVVGGLILGFLRGFIVCIFILFCAVMLNFDRAEIVRKSLLAPRLLKPVRTLLATPPAKLKDALGKQFQTLQEKGPGKH